MERVFRLTAELACIGEADSLPAGSLVLEPHRVASDTTGTDFVFLANIDGGRTWREFSTVVDSAEDWFEPLAAMVERAEAGGW